MPVIGVECMCCEIVAKKGNFTPFRGTVMSAEAMVAGLKNYITKNHVKGDRIDFMLISPLLHSPWVRC